MNKIIERINSLTIKDPKTLIERTLKGVEEYGELAEAVMSHEKVSACAYKGLDSNDITEEAVDVLLVAFAVIYHANPKLSLEELKGLFSKKMDKWENKINK